MRRKKGKEREKRKKKKRKRKEKKRKERRDEMRKGKERNGKEIKEKKENKKKYIFSTANILIHKARLKCEDNRTSLQSKIEFQNFFGIGCTTFEVFLSHWNLENPYVLSRQKCHFISGILQFQAHVSGDFSNFFTRGHQKSLTKINKWRV